MINLIILLKNILYNFKLRRNILSGVQLEKLGINFVGKKVKFLWQERKLTFLYFEEKCLVLFEANRVCY